MKERYYYIRAKRGPRKGARVITVCLIPANVYNFRNEQVFKGYAICSPSEPVDPEFGRFLAYTRALRAMKQGRSPLSVHRREPAGVFTDECGLPCPAYKCCRVSPYDLTAYERKILGYDKQDKKVA